MPRGTKRRAQGTGSIAKQRNGTFFCVLPTVNGVQHKLPGSCPSYAAAAERLDTYLAEHPNWREEVGQTGRTSARRTAPAAPHSDRAVTMYLNQYLTALESGEYEAKPVHLGRIAGFPAVTNDPDVVDAAVKARLAALNGAPPTKKLLVIQRCQQLREDADRLRTGGSTRLQELHAFFVAHAATWGEKHGVTWGAWKELGVPPKVLTEAGITRRG